MPSLVPAITQKVDVTADALRRVAVVASAVDSARGVDVEPLGIDGRCRAAGSGQCSLYRLGHLVESDDEDDFFRSPRDSGYPIAVAIDVHDDTIFRYGVGTRQIDICREVTVR